MDKQHTLSEKLYLLTERAPHIGSRGLEVIGVLDSLFTSLKRHLSFLRPYARNGIFFSTLELPPPRVVILMRLS